MKKILSVLCIIIGILLITYQPEITVEIFSSKQILLVVGITIVPATATVLVGDMLRNRSVATLVMMFSLVVLSFSLSVFTVTKDTSCTLKPYPIGISYLAIGILCSVIVFFSKQKAV